MRKHFIGFVLLAGLLLSAAPVQAQTYFPFGSVAVGISSTGVRVVPFGCYVETNAPSYTTGQIHPCSLTTAGRLRAETPNDSAFDVTSTAVRMLVVDATGTVLAAGADYTQDVALTVGSTAGPMGMMRASAAAPTDVSAGNDAVMRWGNLAGAAANFLVGTSNAIIAGDASGLETQGGVAHDAADAGNPTSLGATAETSISGATMVADGDRSKLYAGIDGVLITRQHANLEDRVSGVAAVTDGSSTSLVASQGAGLRFCATIIVVSNSSATNVTVDLRDGTGGAVLMTIPAAANMGGAVVPLQMPLCTSAATALAADPSAAASTVTTTAVGFKTKL